MHRNLAALERYVGKTFQLEFCEVEVLYLLGGEAGPPFFLCKWVWSDHVYCADPYDVVAFFDDNLNPIRDIDLDSVKQDQ